MSQKMELGGGGLACDPVQRLPIDMTIEIFSHLTILERMRLMCVSKRWREHLLEPYLWRNVDLSAITTELPLDQRETIAPSPWSRVPQSRLVETKDNKIFYMASAEDQSNNRPSRVTQLSRYLDKAIDNMGCRGIDTNSATKKWGFTYFLTSLHLVDCLLDHQFESTYYGHRGFAAFRNLKHLKLESCQNHLRGGLPSHLEVLLVYGGCINHATLRDWKYSHLYGIHTVDITMPSVTNADISKIIGDRPIPDSLRNLTYYAQSDNDYSYLYNYLKYCKLENLTVHGGGFLCLKHLFDALDDTGDSLSSFTCHSVSDACTFESFKSLVEWLDVHSGFRLGDVYFLDCPCSAEVRQRVQDFARRKYIDLEFRDGGYVKGPPFYVRDTSNSTAPMVHGDSSPRDCRLEEAVLGWQRW